jgi:hypothetical protein
MGIVDLLAEVKRGVKFLDNRKWAMATATTCLLVSSAMLAALCADWYKTSWGIGAFDRLSREAGLCGVGIYDRVYWESGGYTHLHRNVPMVPVESATDLTQDASFFNALIAPLDAPEVPSEFRQLQCWKGVCLLERPGTCAATPADKELNAYLRRVGL